MDYKQIIAESWGYTQKNKKLILWFGFLPAMFTTSVGAGYIAYQLFAFKTSWMFDDAEHSSLTQVITFIWDFLKAHVSWTIPLIIVAVLFFIFYMLFPTIAQASAIQMIARNRNGQKEAGVGTGLRHGIMSFLPLFEYHLLIKTFSFFSILIEMSFVVRNLGPAIFKFLMPVFIIFIFISLLLTLLFTYTDFFIVIDRKRVFESMKESGKLVITHWQSTFLITILMIIIGVRIVIQAFLVLAIPGIIILVSGYIATMTLLVTGVIVGLIIGSIVLVIAAYLNGVVDIFSYSVWTFTFLALTSEKELSARDHAVADTENPIAVTPQSDEKPALFSGVEREEYEK
ncbi:MAG: hypothetical protein PHP74_01115 [Candidatus Gracilibacteria bacterium]|nr:hypothetical protein [Candidatus Gracilibacteria bacterium]